MKQFFLLFLLSTILSCQGQDHLNKKMNADEFEQAISKERVQLLDVRNLNEYKSGHLKNALQADWNDRAQFDERIKYMDKSTAVYVYCLGGARSEQAAEYLRKNGYKNVIDLAGGISSWRKNGKPVIEETKIKQYTLEDFNAMIPEDKTVLVNFGADWCPPCVKMKPVLQELVAKKGNELELLKIDAGIHTNLMNALQIEPIPVYILYKNGKEVWRKDGMVSLDEFLAQL